MSQISVSVTGNKGSLNPNTGCVQRVTMHARRCQEPGQPANEGEQRHACQQIRSGEEPRLPPGHGNRDRKAGPAEGSRRHRPAEHQGGAKRREDDHLRRSERQQAHPSNAKEEWNKDQEGSECGQGIPCRGEGGARDQEAEGRPGARGGSRSDQKTRAQHEIPEVGRPSCRALKDREQAVQLKSVGSGDRRVSGDFTAGKREDAAWIASAAD